MVICSIWISINERFIECIELWKKTFCFGCGLNRMESFFNRWCLWIKTFKYSKWNGFWMTEFNWSAKCRTLSAFQRHRVDQQAAWYWCVKRQCVKRLFRIYRKYVCVCVRVCAIEQTTSLESTDSQNTTDERTLIHIYTLQWHNLWHSIGSITAWAPSEWVFSLDNFNANTNTHIAETIFLKLWKRHKNIHSDSSRQ